jgi:hypothetical protein
MIRAVGLPTVVFTNVVPATGWGGGRETDMRGFDCVDPAHGKVHFTGKNDNDLVQTIKTHAATAHPDLTEGQIREMIAGADWWKEMATSGANAGSAQSAYDE